MHCWYWPKTVETLTRNHLPWPGKIVATCMCMHAQLLQSCQIFTTLQTVAMVGYVEGCHTFLQGSSWQASNLHLCCRQVFIAEPPGKPSHLPSTGDLIRNAELTSYHQPKNLGKVKRREGTAVHISYQLPRILLWNSPWLRQAHNQSARTMKSSVIGQRQPGNQSITIKSKTASHMANSSPEFPFTLLISAWGTPSQ